MQKKKVYRIWRFFLPFIFVLSLIHLLKDITQDILKIPTWLDVLGDVKEDISSFPLLFQKLFFILGICSVAGEVFLLTAIPLALKSKKISRVDYAIGIVVVSLLVFFALATLLDPRYKFWR